MSEEELNAMRAIVAWAQAYFDRTQTDMELAILLDSLKLASLR
jgi:hypothetical protein